LEKIEEKQKLLDEYQDLPPNICLANKKIDQIQQESVSVIFALNSLFVENLLKICLNLKT